MKTDKTGKVWLVGAGPSDPGLFTLKGMKVLEEAQVVIYDHLVGAGVLSMMPKDAELIDVGKIAGNHTVPQHEINRIILQKALEGKRVVRLKGGDPFVFGRGGEELELLSENNIPFEVVPGITSAVSVPAYNGIPVTHRDFTSSFHVITGHTRNKDEAEIDYEALVRLEGTLVFLMGVGAMKKICSGLISAGMSEDMPAAVLENGTSAHQRKVVSTVKNLCEDSEKTGIKTPAIIIVGKVCSLADKFSWAEKRPLGKLKVAVTRPKDRASALADRLREQGAEVVLLPSVRTEKRRDNRAISDAINNISDYSWIAFTSPAGVKIFFEILKEKKKDIRNLSGIKFAAIGSATAEAVMQKGIFVDLVPEKYNGGELGKLLAEKVSDKEKILIPRAAIGTEDLIRPLEDKGLYYDDIPVYDTIWETGLAVKYDSSIDAVAFTSASTVKAFAENNKNIDFSSVTAVCIGEQTAKAASDLGMKILISPEATIDAMVRYMTEIFG